MYIDIVFYTSGTWLSRILPWKGGGKRAGISYVGQQTVVPTPAVVLGSHPGV